MGLVASQARLLALTARKSCLEFFGQMINQRRMDLASMQMPGMIGALNPNHPMAQMMQFRMQRLQQIDQMLEMQLKQVDTQQQAVQTEIGAVQKVIDKNIEMSFKTFGN